MKVALIKQELDVFGPWSTVRWTDTSPLSLFDMWPNKAVYWEMTCLLKADWFVVPQSIATDYTRDAVLSHPQREASIRKYTTGVVPRDELPLDDYDVVICFDPVLEASGSRKPLLAYFLQEHWDKLYGSSLRDPQVGFDLFLAHMMDGPTEVRALPQAVSFPYLRSPESVRDLFGREKQRRVYVDWRTLTTLGMSNDWSPATAAAGRLEVYLDYPVTHQRGFWADSYGFADPPRWGDARGYLEDLAKSRFFVSVGRGSGAGQSLCDAASAGCLCVGEADKTYHRMICHPTCLCSDLSELPRRFENLRKSSSLQAEVATWQDERLEEAFARQPLRVLHDALVQKSAGVGGDSTDV